MTAVADLLQLMLTLLGVVALPDAGQLGLAVVVIALLLVSLTLRAVVCALVAGHRPWQAPREIDVSITPAHSDPDARGHARPRAPGFAARAA